MVIQDVRGRRTVQKLDAQYYEIERCLEMITLNWIAAQSWSDGVWNDRGLLSGENMFSGLLLPAKILI